MSRKAENGIGQKFIDTSSEFGHGRFHFVKYVWLISWFEMVSSIFLGPGGAWVDNHSGLGLEALAPGCGEACKTN